MAALAPISGIPEERDGALRALLASVAPPAVLVDDGGVVLATNPSQGALPLGLECGATLGHALPGVDVRRLLGGDSVEVTEHGGKSLRVLAMPLDGGRALVSFREVPAARPDDVRSTERVEVAARTIAAVRHELAGIIQTLMNQPFIARRAFARSAEQGLAQLTTMDEQINMLIDRLRNFDRLPAALRTSDRRMVDVGDLLGVFVEAEPRLRLQAPSPPYEVCGDHVQLSAALDGVIRNALEFSPAEAVVEVALLVADEVLTIRVQDRGASPWHPSPHGVHDPFYTTKHRDLGLGLTVAHAVAHRHGGRLEIAPRSGGGSCVSLVLPLGAYPGKAVDDSTVRPLP